ncbi:hypothetical protein [Microbacterium sp. 179-I 3D4 NHS]|uniref:hypothetical protein n=1 Tax=Microbacterium sp. 179-I 3D4 NHS TaxID=3142381 RepID=UPI00399FFF6D
MTTSDQQGPLTRKQLRELRLTGSTPIITEDAAPAAPPVPPPPAPVETPAESAPTAEQVDLDAAPLTRRQARAQERVRTASVPVVTPEEAVAAAPESPEDGPTVEERELVLEAQPVADAADQAAPVEEAEAVVEPVAEAEPEEDAEPVAPAAESSGIVSGVPDFPSAEVRDEDDVDDEVQVAPVSAAGAAQSVGEVPLEVVDEKGDESDDLRDVLGVDDADDRPDDVLADVGSEDEATAEGERPTVNPAFGQGVLKDSSKPFAPSFDDLLSVGDSGGSQHGASNALIFTPSAGEGSLSGPVASTGEILITGSYELPRGIGSQGHAHGAADGKDVDAVLIDGELPPASSPTPIAASSAVSTIKPAGEVIRPPAPEKGNKLMLILAIVAGGLALALGVALVFAFTTNVF